MRFARVVSAYDSYNPNIEYLVDKADLDVLQLDYLWPQRAAEGDHSRSSSAAGFLRQLSTLQKSMFLDPNLHVITNAGGGNTSGCVEALAEYLCEHGGAEMPITSIRGDNLFDRLEELMAAGIELRDAKRGITLHELTRPLLSAHVELGAGPIKTALDEGSRIVVTGCYDCAAPMIAAAIHSTQLTWEDYESLAQLACASRIDEQVIEYEFASGVEVQWKRSAESAAPVSELARRPSEFADVHCSSPAGVISGNMDFQNLGGSAPSGNWILGVEYVSNYTTSVLLEPMEESLQDILGELRKNFVRPSERETDCAVEWMNSERIPQRRILVSASFGERKSCEAFLAEMKHWIARRIDCGLLRSTNLPSLEYEVAQFRCEVPRDAIAVSVDTRPANEWR